MLDSLRHTKPRQTNLHNMHYLPVFITILWEPHPLPYLASANEYVHRCETLQITSRKDPLYPSDHSYQHKDMGNRLGWLLYTRTEYSPFLTRLDWTNRPPEGKVWYTTKTGLME